MSVEHDVCPNGRHSHQGTVFGPVVRAPATPAHGWYGPVKAVKDSVLALLLLVPAVPLIAIGAVLVRLTSRGPAFYHQTRLGRAGRPYTLYKIRTMVHNCEQLTGPRWATARDPRVTPVGRILRRIHVDELPQLWNVLRGEMSLVGPPPERPEFVTRLEQAIPLYRDRLLVRPGLTGFSQVQLPADTDLDSVRRKLVYDLYYVRQLGLWLDLRILASTALYVLGVPFAVLYRLFLLPGPDVVERTYHDHVARAELPPYLQPAWGDSA